ncbi:MAG TPA: helix-turn-helix transcriptional regulator [Micromonosporaceae bacterium]
MSVTFDREPRRRAFAGYPIAGLVRRARRIADMSQRQMARFARVAPGTVGKVETGALVPSVDVLARLLGRGRPVPDRR